jgi:(p)ppGpp synthase/HD superfamily hydrolase
VKWSLQIKLVQNCVGHKVQNSQVRKRSRRLTKRFLAALSYATQLYANQTRKGTDEPYIGHLLGVASLVLQHGGNENEAIAAQWRHCREELNRAPLGHETWGY